MPILTIAPLVATCALVFTYLRRVCLALTVQKSEVSENVPLVSCVSLALNGNESQRESFSALITCMMTLYL